MGRFDGKTAIVTGGALGIGGGVARRLAADGANVLIADITDDAAAANVTRIKDAGGNAISIHANMGSRDDIERMVQSAQSMAQVTLTTEADVTEMIRLREALVSQWRQARIRPLDLDLIIKAVAAALKENPRLNATLEI